MGLNDLVKHLNLSEDEAIERVYGGSPMYCTLAKEGEGKPDPAKSYREIGWVLRRNCVELPQYRIRRVPDGYQPVVYKTAFDAGGYNGQSDPIADVFANRDSNPFQARRTWKQAVKDLFDERAPGIVPIDSLQNDQWRIRRMGGGAVEHGAGQA